MVRYRQRVFPPAQALGSGTSGPREAGKMPFGIMLAKVLGWCALRMFGVFGAAGMHGRFVVKA